MDLGLFAWREQLAGKPDYVIMMRFNKRLKSVI
jgi:hypothetical protein